VKISITFENCEVIDVTAVNSAETCIVGDVVDHIEYSKWNDVCYARKHAGYVYIKLINPDAEVTARCLKYDDITNIAIDGVNYYIPWVAVDEDVWVDINPSQVAKYEDGVLEITIGEKDDYIY
tara:strand:- start:3496 stop:3864 length:369 start_codon:yes stop_codon:yes gene_type:complete